MMAATPPDAPTLPAVAQRDSGPPGPRLKDVARGSALNLIGALVAAVTTLVLTVVITREYSKPVAGAFFTAISLFLIVENAAGLGAWVGLVNFIARLRRLGHEDRVSTILRAAIIPVIVISLACTAGMLLFAEPLAHLLLSGHLGKDGAAPGMVADALRALALALPFAALSDTLLGAARGYRAMKPTVVVDKIGRSTAQLIGITIAIAAGSVALLAPLWALPYVPAAALGWYWLRRVRRDHRLDAGTAGGSAAVGVSASGSPVPPAARQRSPGTR